MTSRQWIAAVSMLGLFVFGIFFYSHTVFAAVTSTSLATVGSSSGLPQVGIGILIARIIRIILGVLGILTVILVIYGGFLYLLSGGDPDKIKKAKKVLTSTLIGLVIILTSYSLASWILNKLTEALMGSGSITSTIQKFSEPFAGSLGAGIVENHLPARNAVDVPRNTKVFVTFKAEIDPKTIIEKFDPNCTYAVAVPPAPQAPPLCETGLKKGSVQIVKTAELDTAYTKALTSAQVDVMTTDSKTFVFNFKKGGYLGSNDALINYTVFLSPSIQLANNKGPAFVAENSAGYAWNFTTSKTFDTTSPKIVSVISEPGSNPDRNITVEITFDEPMDPIVATGINNKAVGFDHIKTSAYLLADPEKKVSDVFGTYTISNGYKTVDFTTDDYCAKDPCFNKIYCLPGLSAITVRAKAATLSNDKTEWPQAKLDGAGYNGLTDAAGNSLDGNDGKEGKGDGKVCGSTENANCYCENSKSICAKVGVTNDDYSWSFNTTDGKDITSPKIISLSATSKSTGLPVLGVNAGGIDLEKPLEITFEKLLLASSVSSSNITLSSDPVQKSLWFVNGKTDVPNAKPTDKPTQSIVQINHATFLPPSESPNQSYWPLFTMGIKGINQFCMSPASGPGENVGETCTGTDTNPYCCNQTTPQNTACKDDSGKTLHP